MERIYLELVIILNEGGESIKDNREMRPSSINIFPVLLKTLI